MQKGYWLTRKHSKAFDLNNECRKFTIGTNAKRIKDQQEMISIKKYFVHVFKNVISSVNFCQSGEKIIKMIFVV